MADSRGNEIAGGAPEALGLDLRHESDAELSRMRLNAEIPSSLAHYFLQEPARRRGRFVTFYSYKGGVGRSRALANVALQLARQKKSVLCIDFDLEAPGLHHYFLGEAFTWPGGDPVLHLGLVDFVHAYRDSLFARVSKPPIQRGELVQTIQVKDGTDLAFIGAGRQDRDYKQKVSNFDWKSFYEHWDGGIVIDEFKREFAERFDYVLIDSRTGITDISGICSVHLPDILVAVFTPGPQSQVGLVDALQSIEANRVALRPHDPLSVLPLPCRVDRDVVRDAFDAGSGSSSTHTWPRNWRCSPGCGLRSNTFGRSLSSISRASCMTIRSSLWSIMWMMRGAMLGSIAI